MEVPVINRMTEFEPTHSFISRILSLSSVPPRFWKWGALFLALVYAFSSMAFKIKILILHYHKKSKSLLAATEPLLPNFDDDLCTDDESDDVSISSVSSFDAEEDEDDDPVSSSDDFPRYHEDFRVKGSFGNFSQSSLRKRKFKIRRRRSIGDDFSLSDLVNGSGVVKIWDGSFLGDFPAVSISPSVLFSAGGGDDGVLGLGLWDFRTSRRTPDVQAEWRSNRRSRGVDVDVRKLDTPLEKSTTALEEDTWWDADGVTVTAESSQ